MRIKILFILFILLFLISGCFPDERDKNTRPSKVGFYGLVADKQPNNIQTIYLDRGIKFVSYQFNEGRSGILITKKMKHNDEPECYLVSNVVKQESELNSLSKIHKDLIQFCELK